MEIFSIACLVTSITSLTVGLYVYLLNIKGAINKTWLYLNLSVALWSLGLSLMTNAHSLNEATAWLRVHYTGASLIPATYFHFICTVLGYSKKAKRSIKFIYLLGFMFLLSTYWNSMLVKLPAPKLSFRFYTVAGPLYIPYTLMFFICVMCSIGLVIKSYKGLTGYKRNQIKYIIISSLIGFGGGTTAFFPVFNIKIYPYGMYIVFIYPLIITYAIVRYRLMDINVAVTRAAVFLIVYAAVLGIPFYIGYHTKLWIISTTFAVVLATLGPVIYTRLRKRAEDILLAKQKRYQEALLAASRGMTLIKDLDKLVTLIARIMRKYIGVTHAHVYLQDPEVNGYRLYQKETEENKQQNGTEAEVIPYKSLLIEHLKKHKKIILFDELNLQEGNSHLVSEMQKLDADIIIPCLALDELLGFLVMGKKKSKDMYTLDDLSIFETLSNNAALAVENAINWQESKKTLADQFHEHRLRSLGQMGSHMGHQVGNRFQAVWTKGDELLITSIENLLNTNLTDEQKNHVKYIQETIKAMNDDARLGGDVAKQLKDFSAKEIRISPIDLNDIIIAALQLLKCKFNVAELNLKTDIEKTHLKIRADEALLQDILFNLLDNAHDAQNSKKEEQKDYTPQTNIKACIKENLWYIEVFDNGIGMDEKTLERLFLPFVSTKASSGKGTGIGLTVIKKMINELKGTIKAESTYGKGTTFYLTLPAIDPKEFKKT